jgi:hypothetical protein
MTYEELWQTALTIGKAAGDQAKPIPMTVQQHENVLVDNSPVVKSWNVPDGVCGFAGIVFRPATQPFVRWLVKQYPEATHKHYQGGREFFVRDFGQSMQRKEACAGAMCRFFESHGIKCDTWSRMD